MQDSQDRPEAQSLIELTTTIATAYVSNNQISPADVARLISDVGRQLTALGEAPAAPEPEPGPAVPVRRSIGTDHLICLVCGKRQRMLKRHLSSEHGLTPDAYRQRFGLKPDYPMTAPSYTAQRRQLALDIGLGRPKKPGRKPKAAPKRARRSSPPPA